MVEIDAISTTKFTPNSQLVLDSIDAENAAANVRFLIAIIVRIVSKRIS